MFIVKFVPLVVPGVLGYASNINVQALLDETNAVRQKNGLKPLTYNSELELAAQRKANDMFTEDYWAHVSPSGVKPWDFIIAAGYDYEYAGENLAKNFSNSDEVVTAWFNSSSHRDNLLNANYDEVGFAVVNGELEGYETTLVVQMFGKTRTPSYLASEDSTLPIETAPVAVPEVQEVPVSNQVVKQEAMPLVDHAPEGAPAPSELLINLSEAPRYIVAVFVGFLLALLGVDLWYSHRRKIYKFTGHTIAHITFLLFILGSVLFMLSPGKIL